MRRSERLKHDNKTKILEKDINDLIIINEKLILYLDKNNELLKKNHFLEKKNDFLSRSNINLNKKLFKLEEEKDKYKYFCNKNDILLKTLEDKQIISNNTILYFLLLTMFLIILNISNYRFECI